MPNTLYVPGRDCRLDGIRGVVFDLIATALCEDGLIHEALSTYPIREHWVNTVVARAAEAVLEEFRRRMTPAEQNRILWHFRPDDLRASAGRSRIGLPPPVTGVVSGTTQTLVQKIGVEPASLEGLF